MHLLSHIYRFLRIKFDSPILITIALLTTTTLRQNNMSKRIDASAFYGEYHGHQVGHLEQLHAYFKEQNPNQKFIYFVGDSSLDNKFWLSGTTRGVNGYESILHPNCVKPDVCHHLNRQLVAHNNDEYVVINAAIEESALFDRRNGTLLPQDVFVQNHITSEDILIVSLGGNDIALKPTISTIYNMIVMTHLNTLDTIKKGPNYAWGMNHFIHLFHDLVQDYLNRLLIHTIPKQVIVCMIYYPDIHATGSWADRTLNTLGYSKDPYRLQAAIEQMYLHGTCAIKLKQNTIPITPFAMFHILNGSNSNDYIQRVEPSDSGGEKLAKAFYTTCFLNDQDNMKDKDINK